VKKISRRDFLKTVAVGGAALGIGNVVPFNIIQSAAGNAGPGIRPIVSVVKIKKI